VVASPPTPTGRFPDVPGTRDLRLVGAALATATASTVLLVLGVRFGWLGPDVGRGATFWKATRDGWVKQPANSLSNLGFVAAGLAIGWRARHRARLGDTLPRLRGTPTAETPMDLVIRDGSRVGTIYFLMSEENIAKQIRKPWVSIGSDASSQAPEGAFLKSQPHPRAYGSFARVLGKYAREDGTITMAEAVRRLTSLPAANLRIKRRGSLGPGFFADVVVFDAAAIIDRATFEKPQQYAVGVKHVFVNGVQVLDNGEHTNAKPGRVVHGPGFGRRVAMRPGRDGAR